MPNYFIHPDSIPPQANDWADNIVAMGVNLFENDIDETIIQTNSFLQNGAFISAQDGGPFHWILEICMILSSMFCLVLAANMAYKMMVKHEGIDALKLFKPLAVSLVLAWWYPPSLQGTGTSNECVLDYLAALPNAIGSYTHDLYQVEAMNVQDTYLRTEMLMEVRDSLYKQDLARKEMASSMLNKMAEEGNTQIDSDAGINAQAESSLKDFIQSGYAGLIILIDKILMVVSLVVYRIGWWGVMYSQQIMLGVLTIFGPIHWAMSLLPKWEGAWAKWITKYLSVHLFGAMLYFVGFYVLLLFDIVLSMQYADLFALTANEASFEAYVRSTFLTTGYLMAASIVAVKCLEMVPDLAAMMIPEGEASFSARAFGAGIADGMKNKFAGITGGII